MIWDEIRFDNEDLKTHKQLNKVLLEQIKENKMETLEFELLKEQKIRREILLVKSQKMVKSLMRRMENLQKKEL
jgi:hypothetical protein